VRVVLDASAAVNALIPGHLRDATLRHLDDAEVFAPDVIDAKVLSALARLERAGAIATSEAENALRAWLRLPCTRLTTEPVLPDIWALRHAIRVTDAHYVVLARVLGATVLTADRRLARAALPDLSLVLIG
jgi:predicted nucleic acid-binding protein